MQKEAEPRALAAPCLADAVHAVVPVAAAEQRQPVRASRDAALDRAQAVLEQRAVFAGHGRRRRTTSCSSAVSSGASRNGTRSSSTPVSPVVRTYSATTCGSQSRSSEQRRAEAAAGRLVPPVLHVAFDELPAGGAQEVLARQVGPREGQRHHVLQLVAEAEGAAGLVVAAARPEPAADGLVEQPPVHQRIERVVRRPHLDGVERAVPRRLHPRERGLRGGHVSVARDQLPWHGRDRCLRPAGTASRRRSPGCSTHADLKRRAGIQRRRRRGPRARCGPARPAATSSPLRPMNDARSPVTDAGASLAYENATWRPKSWL